MVTAPGTIPYEKQSDLGTSRMCGAACLSMVYRSFGKVAPQAEIWPAIAKVNRFGSLASTTHLMAKDALARDLAAVVFQARHPIQALRLCREAGARAIVNHRLEPDSPAGHYSVMVDLDASHVYLHDPYIGPARRLSHAELLDLWQPKFPNSEIVGGFLIAIAGKQDAFNPCPFCHTPAMASVDCPNCGKPVGLQPVAVLGCMNRECVARQWNYICCPACDLVWDFQTRQEMPGVPAEGVASPEPATDPEIRVFPPTLEPVLDAIEKFMEKVTSLPEVVANPELKPHLDGIRNSRTTLTEAFTKAAANARIHQGQMAAFIKASEERRQAYNQRKAALVKTGEPLDGEALGRALLKTFGFID